ncbi:MAG: hypothetical protein ACREJG_11630 [Candidatus Rokuibacteriota bacterium]
MEPVGRWSALILGILGLLGYGGGPAYAQLNCNVGVGFYPGGALRSCVLNGHHRMHTALGQSLTCANGHTAVLYENGRLQSCLLAQPLTSSSLPCETGSRVEFRPDGTLTGCLPGPGRSHGGDPSWHYTVGRERTAQQAILCRHREVVLGVAEVFRREGSRAGYAALGRARGCETRVESFTPRAVVAHVPIPLGNGDGYTVRFVEVATAAGLVEYLITTRDVRP